jgi:DNA-binding NarL/FixJ family response regulator
MKKGIDILIVDDSPINLLGLRMIASEEPAITSVCEAHDPAEALSCIGSSKAIDVAVVDISMNTETDGLDLIAKIGTEHPEIKTMVLSQYKNPHFIYRAISSGARAYIAKDSNPETIVKAILDVYYGHCRFFGDTIPQETLLQLFGSDCLKAEGKPYSLTRKEIEILQSVTDGFSNGEIASIMNISSNTVESYKDRIKWKLGYDSIIECVAFAISHGIVTFKES